MRKLFFIFFLLPFALNAQTTFYLGNGGAPISPTLNQPTVFTITTSADRAKATTVKDGTAMASKTSASSSATNDKVLIRQFVTDQLAAQTINSGTTFRSQVRTLISSTAASNAGKIIVSIYTVDNTGTLKTAIGNATGATAYATSLTNRTVTITAGSNVSVADGDRLVIEVGWIHSAGSAARTSDASFGGNAASDLAQDETTTAANNPWCQSSQTLTMYVPPVNLLASMGVGGAPPPVGGAFMTVSTTGATITTDGNFKVYSFTSTSGTFQVTATGSDVTYGSNVEVLVVGGGGGGGHSVGGGGGAGGVKYESSHAVTVQSYSITVAAGALGSSDLQSDNNQNTGDNSVFDTITADGGGGGTGFGATVTPGNGGSGGGAGGRNSGTQSGGTGTAGEGNNGGSGTFVSSTQRPSGGGGGSSAAGSNGSADQSGNGGNGTSYSITGTATVYGGGGGGGANNSSTNLAGSGGTGGGGAGSAWNSTSSGGNATANTGGGGGGGPASHAGGNGGSGVVIIRVKFQ